MSKQKPNFLIIMTARKIMAHKEVEMLGGDPTDRRIIYTNSSYSWKDIDKGNAVWTDMATFGVFEEAEYEDVVERFGPRVSLEEGLRKIGLLL